MALLAGLHPHLCATHPHTRASPSESEQGPVALWLVPFTGRRFSLQDLIRVHHSFLRAIDVAMMAGGGTLAKVFLEFKERWVWPLPAAGPWGRLGALWVRAGQCRADRLYRWGPLAVCRPRQVACVHMCMCVYACAHV